MGRWTRGGRDVGTSFKAKADSSVDGVGRKSWDLCCPEAPTLLSVSLLGSNKWAVHHAHLLHTSRAEGLDWGTITWLYPSARWRLSLPPFLYFLIFILFLCVRVVCLYVCAPPGIRYLALESQMVVSCHLGAENQTWDLWRSSHCSYPWSRLLQWPHFLLMNRLEIAELAQSRNVEKSQG